MDLTTTPAKLREITEEEAQQLDQNPLIEYWKENIYTKAKVADVNIRKLNFVSDILKLKNENTKEIPEIQKSLQSLIDLPVQSPGSSLNTKSKANTSIESSILLNRSENDKVQSDNASSRTNPKVIKHTKQNSTPSKNNSKNITNDEHNSNIIKDNPKSETKNEQVDMSTTKSQPISSNVNQNSIEKKNSINSIADLVIADINQEKTPTKTGTLTQVAVKIYQTHESQKNEKSVPWTIQGLIKLNKFHAIDSYENENFFSELKSKLQNSSPERLKIIKPIRNGDESIELLQIDLESKNENQAESPAFFISTDIAKSLNIVPVK